jgi:ceramide glucosyltransferase
MSAIAYYAGAALLALSAAGAGYAAVASWATRRFLRRPLTPVQDASSVTILRPMKGAEPQFDANLESLVAQDYPGVVQIILGADSAQDPAYVAAARLKAVHPDRDIVLVADATQHGTNRKLSNLINMSARATGDILVISDSDVRLPQAGLSAFVGALQQPGVGLVYGLYRGRPAGNLWSRLAALDINARFAANVVVGQALGAHPVLGPTMAVRAATLQAAGGFEGLKDVLADDFELGRMVRGQGLSIACPPLLIDHVFPERTLGELWRHELRWARTIRLLNPGGYIGSVVTYSLPLGITGVLLTGLSAWAVEVLAVVALMRMLECWEQCRALKADKSAIWLFPLRDLLAFAVFLAAFFGDGVEWRGNRLRVKADGAMASR